MENWPEPPYQPPLPPQLDPVTGQPVPGPARANKVYLLLVFLLVTTSVLSALLPNLRWFLLLAGDPILLAAVLWVAWREKRALRPALRWNWPGLTQMGLGLLMGLGAYATGVLVQLVVTLIVGPVQSVDLRALASDPLMLAAFVAAAVIMAPLCEELIFRGYFLGIYEHFLPPPASLTLVALLFAVLHLEFFGIFSLLPAAFLLTYMAMRSGSLGAGIAAHFAFNLAGSTLGLLAIKVSPLLSGLLVCGLLVAGPLVGFFALLAYRRIVPPPPAPARLAVAGSWLGRFWPLVIAGLVYLTFAGAELIMTRFPQVLAGPTPALSQPDFQLPAQFTYQADTLFPFEPPASIDCSLAAQGAGLALDCTRTQPKALLTPETSLHWTVTWQAETLDLQSATYTYTGGPNPWSAELNSQADGSFSYNLKPANGPQRTASLPAGALIDGSWPWQLSGLDFTTVRTRGGRVQMVTIDASGNPTLHETALQTTGLEPDDVPAGSYQTWNVKIGRENAHYNIEAPHLPIDFTWGGATYQLKK
jgi:membrane protease YdiL (CAAX protease family)